MTLILPGGAGDFASTPDHPSLDIPGTVTLIVDVALDDWTPSSAMALLSKFTETGEQRSYRLELLSTGDLSAETSFDGGVQVGRTSDVLGFADGSRHAVAVEINPSDGGNRSYSFFTGPSVDGPWTSAGSDVRAGAGAIFSSSADVIVGAINAGAGNPLAGRVFAAQVRSGDRNGTIVANPQFAGLISGVSGEFGDSTGKVWTVAGEAKLESPFGGGRTTLPHDIRF